MRRFTFGLAALLFAGEAAAQSSETPAIISQRLSPTTAASDFLVTFAMPELPRFGFSLGLFSNLQLNPVTVRFVFNNGSGPELGGDAVKVVSSQLVTNVTGAFSILGKAEISFDAPLFLEQNGEGLSTAGGAGTGIPARGVGDPKFYLRAKAFSAALGDDGTISLGGVGGLSLPLGDETGFMGEGGATASLRAVGDVHWKQLQFTGNVGYLTRPQRTFLTLVIDDEIFYSVAAAYQFQPSIAAAVELYGGANADSDIRDVDSSHLESDVSFRFNTQTGLAVTGGIGAGLIAGVGNPDLRFFAGVRYQPSQRGDSDHDGITDEEDKCPLRKETKNDFDDEDGCPDQLPAGELANRVTDPNDEDADGVPNADDKCPESPEDNDKFQDEDGCPDPDNDGDGVKDASDECDDEKEDIDNYQDGDGCIDPDNDNDTIADVNDKCPNEPEDKDGLADTDGCPETDADNDGLADTEETCPGESETFNGNADDDGCPDEGASALTMPAGDAGIIQGAEKISFVKGKVQLTPDSVAVLDELVARMRVVKTANLSLVVSPEKEGKPAEEMAAARGEVLKNYLVGFGVSEDRIRVSTDKSYAGKVSLTLTPASPAH